MLIAALPLVLILVGIYIGFMKTDDGMKIRMTLSQRIRKSAERQVELKGQYLDQRKRRIIRKVNFYRNVIALFVLFIILFQFAIGGGGGRDIIGKFALLALLYLLTMPKDNVGGIDTPVQRVLWHIEKSRIAKLDKEIYQSATTLKTLSLLNSDDTFSADYIYEKLFEHSTKLKKQYGYFLALYRGGKREEAFAQLRKDIDTGGGRQFALILEKLDYLNPKEMVCQIESFQKGLLEEISTEKTKEIDKNSVIITLASTITILAIILNFAVVGVFMDSLEMIKGIF